jgi:hypothetical protein
MSWLSKYSAALVRYTLGNLYESYWEHLIRTVHEISIRKLPLALHDPCAFELILLGNTDQTLISDVLSYKCIFSARDIWISGEFYCFQTTSVDLCISFPGQKLLVAFVGPLINDGLIEWLIVIRLVQKNEFTAMSRTKTIS